MTHTRRYFLTAAAAAFGTTTVLPYAIRAEDHAGDTFNTPAGDIVVHPVNHASFVMTTPPGVIYCDPVGDPAIYAELPRPDLILLTHHHGDHYKPETLAALVGDNTKLITNPEVFNMLPDNLKTKADQIANGEKATFEGLTIDAIPAYNITQDRMKFHPVGRDNGYVLNFDGLRTYISGDSEDIPEMRALKGIDLAFVCMNLPFTMDVKAAASAVAQFKPKFVYPYHYRGREGGTQDPAEFANLVGDGAAVNLADWYS
ncbi:MAG: MBL fold metallo-hydrolase [Rhizobiaceae bacterium]|nr:MBL fold metallo-hydrolase [Rhizobiaceae bacterium]